MGGIRQAAVSTLFSVVAGVDDIILDEGTGCGQKRAPPPDGRRRSGLRRGLYWVEEEKLGTVASGHQSAQGELPFGLTGHRRHRIFQIAGELEGGVAVVHLEGEGLYVCG